MFSQTREMTTEVGDQFLRFCHEQTLSGCISSVSLGQDGKQHTPESPESFPLTTVCKRELSTDPGEAYHPFHPGMVGHDAACTQAGSLIAVELLHKDKISAAGLRDSQVFK